MADTIKWVRTSPKKYRAVYPTTHPDIEALIFGSARGSLWCMIVWSSRPITHTVEYETDFRRAKRWAEAQMKAAEERNG